MADADEDAIRPGPSNEDDDQLEDEAQDFRFLAKLSTSSTSADATSSNPTGLPKRGVKDFEPLPTNLQASSLAASRQAMHDALSEERYHAPKSHMIGVYDPTTGLTSVKRPKGSSAFATMGKGRSWGVELLPEEALYMVERGTLDLRWPVEEGTMVAEQEEARVEEADASNEGGGKKRGAELADDEQGVPMSLQGAYAALIRRETQTGAALTLERYQVYANLRRAGYVVLRADTFDGVLDPDHTADTAQNNEKEKHEPSYLIHKYGLVGWLCERLFGTPAQAQAHQLPTSPMVKPGHYRSYNDMYRALRLIRTRNSPHPCPLTSAFPNAASLAPQRAPIAPTYNLYNTLTPSGAPFRKSAPGEPAFRVCVLAAQDSAAPTLPQLISLLAHSKPSKALASAENEAATPLPSTNASPSPTQPNTGTMASAYGRLKNPAPSAILAVVDSGVVSYMRVGAADFAAEKVYERYDAAMRGRFSGPGRGGRGGNRGRGRGKK